MDIGGKIRFYREQKGYTVNKLANLCGISQSYLREVELNSKNPTVEMLNIICDSLEISLKDFFDEEFDDSKRFKNEPLLASIYKLDAKQRKLLKQFIDSVLTK